MRSSIRLIFFIVVLASCSGLPCRPADDGALTLEHEGLKDILDSYSNSNNSIGLQASIIMPDGKMLNAVSGYADISGRRSLDPGDHLLIGSITKVYTAAMVMTLVEKGLLSLDDTIDRWISAPFSNRVTLRMLLNHTSGIKSYTSSPYYLVRLFLQPKKIWKQEQVFKYFINDPLLFEPGSKYNYSSSNYLFLGLIIEKASGMNYGLFLRKLLQEKLGLKNTCFDCPPGFIISNGYDKSLLHLGLTRMSKFTDARQTSSSSAGGIASTSSDTAIFIHGLFTGSFLNPSALNQMLKFTDIKDKDYPSLTGYGLGVKRFTIDGEELFGHTGTNPGYSSIAAHNANKKYTICILSNLSRIDQELIVSKIISGIIKSP